MDGFWVLVILGGIVFWIYSMGHQDGKRIGSRKGYNVGRSHGRRSRR